MTTTLELTDRCGECGHPRSTHPGHARCLRDCGCFAFSEPKSCGECGHLKTSHEAAAFRCDMCACKAFREHTPADFPEDNRMKIAALCGVLEFQLESIRFELNRDFRRASAQQTSDVQHYVDNAEKTFAELRRLALSRD